MNFFKNRPWRRALLWLLLIAPFFYLSYGLANHLASQREMVPTIVFDWERQIPFWAWTIFPYWSINLFYGLSLFIARTRHELDRHALRLLTAQVVAVSFFILLPLQFSFGQPPAEGAAGFMFDALRGFDKPFNQAPSLHIALAIILWDFYRRFIGPVWARLILHVWVWAICASVLTTFQHHFFDIPTGALLGLFCVWFWPLERIASMRQAFKIARTAQRWKLTALYSTGALIIFAFAIAMGSWALWLIWISVSLLLVALNYAGFGARGFQMRRNGKMRWAARWLLFPYRIAAWFNAKWWTRNIADGGEIIPGVWLGKLPDEAHWNAAGQPFLVSLCAELQAPKGARDKRAFSIPVLDLTPPNACDLKRAALIIQNQKNRGQTVWIVCALGFSRSARTVMNWLVIAGYATNLDEAEQMIRKVRPSIVVKKLGDN